MAIRLRLPPDTTAPGMARDRLVELTPPVPSRIIEDVRLLVSELVTNAVKYGTEHGQDVLRIVIEAEGESLRVEIEQPGPATGLKPGEPRPDAQDFRGLGLYIVDELADDWGAEPGPPGHVWFEFLARSRREGPDHPWG